MKFMLYFTFELRDSEMAYIMRMIPPTMMEILRSLLCLLMTLSRRGGVSSNLDILLMVYMIIDDAAIIGQQMMGSHSLCFRTPADSLSSPRSSGTSYSQRCSGIVCSRVSSLNTALLISIFI